MSPVAKRIHEGTLPEDPKEATEKLGPLKAVLEGIPEVRSHFPP